MKLNIRTNLIFSIAEALFTAGSLLVVYKLILVHLSLSMLGVWSVVGAATSLARLGDLGLSDGVTRLVAEVRAKDAHVEAAILLETATISVSAIYSSLALVAYLPARAAMQYFLPPSGFSVAVALIPLSLTSFVLVNISSVLFSGLSGSLKSYYRSIITISSNIVLVGVALYLVPRVGLFGIAWAQVSQGAFNILVSWIILRAELTEIHIVPTRFKITAVLPLLKFGARMQLGSIAIFFFEPVTKMIMARIGGLEAAGTYELAGRITQQARSLIIVSNRTLIAPFAHLGREAASTTRPIFWRATLYTTATTFLLLGGLAVAAPLTQAALVHGSSRYFVPFSIIVAVGWIVNTLTVPVYMLSIGLGRIRYNVLSQIAIAVTAAPLCIILGYHFSAIGVAVGAMLALWIGSGVVMLGLIGEYGTVAPIPCVFRKPRKTSGRT